MSTTANLSKSLDRLSPLAILSLLALMVDPSSISSFFPVVYSGLFLAAVASLWYRKTLPPAHPAWLVCSPPMLMLALVAVRHTPVGSLLVYAATLIAIYHLDRLAAQTIAANGMPRFWRVLYTVLCAGWLFAFPVVFALYVG